MSPLVEALLVAALFVFPLRETAACALGSCTGKDDTTTFLQLKSSVENGATRTAKTAGDLAHQPAEADSMPDNLDNGKVFDTADGHSDRYMMDPMKNQKLMQKAAEGRSPGPNLGLYQSMPQKQYVHISLAGLEGNDKDCIYLSAGTGSLPSNYYYHFPNRPDKNEWFIQLERSISQSNPLYVYFGSGHGRSCRDYFAGTQNWWERYGCLDTESVPCAPTEWGGYMKVVQIGSYELTIDPEEHQSRLEFKAGTVAEPTAQQLENIPLHEGCPVDYNELVQAPVQHVFRKAPNAAQAARLQEAKLCKTISEVIKQVSPSGEDIDVALSPEDIKQGAQAALDRGGEKALTEYWLSIRHKCTEYQEIMVSQECKAPLENWAGKLADQDYTVFSPKYRDWFLENMRKKSPCWRYEIWYTGDHAAGMGAKTFNCFMRNAYHLGFQGDLENPGVLPDVIYQASMALSRELVSHVGPHKWSQSQTDLTYRGSFCMPLNEGDNVYTAGFVSTSPLPQGGQYITANNCVYGFKNFVAGVPVSRYAATEEEVLIPQGLCFNVKSTMARDPDRKKFLWMEDNPNQVEARRVLSKLLYQSEFLLEGIACGMDMSDYNIM